MLVTVLFCSYAVRTINMEPTPGIVRCDAMSAKPHLHNTASLAEPCAQFFR